MVFNDDIKEVLNKIAKRSEIKIEYYDGFIVMFDKVNVHALARYRIVFGKKMMFIYWCYIMVNIMKMMRYSMWMKKSIHYLRLRGMLGLVLLTETSKK